MKAKEQLNQSGLRESSAWHALKSTAANDEIMHREKGEDALKAFLCGMPRAAQKAGRFTSVCAPSTSFRSEARGLLKHEVAILAYERAGRYIEKSKPGQFRMP